MGNYILITPVKNEENNINNLIKSVVNQTVRPILWIIIDDNSSDNSYYFMREANKKYDWIRCIKLSSDKKERDLGFHLPHIMQDGVDIAYNLSESENKSFNFIANVDADIQLDKDYFKNLIKQFTINTKLGIASGIALIKYKNDYTPAKSADIPSGGVMLIRKECFEICGGFPFSYSYDSVLNVKARLNGWDIKRFQSAKHYSTRYGKGADSDWKRYVVLGKSHYYIGYNPIISILKGIKFCFVSPHNIGVAYIYGYFADMITLKSRIPDKDVRNYFKYDKFREIFKRSLYSIKI